MSCNKYLSKPGDTFEAIGSEQVLLGLVAMTTDSEGLYAAIKLLTLVVNSNPRLQQVTEKIYNNRFFQ